jgi:RNA polymerase sigma factor (sigma-70 family)
MTGSDAISVEYEQKIHEMLAAIRSGDRNEFDLLVETVGHELKKLSAYFLRKRRTQTLQTTALVNEILIRLLKLIEDDPKRMPETRTHFISLTCRMMRFTISDHVNAPANRLQTVPLEGGDDKAGNGSQKRMDLPLPQQGGGLSQDDMVALHEALEGLEQDDQKHHKRRYEVIELHLFGGLKYQEIASTLNISPDKARRECEAGLLWLREKLTTTEKC